MKNTILMIAFAITMVYTVLSQDIIDPPKLPRNFTNTNLYDPYYNVNHFLKGWNWGSAGARLEILMHLLIFVLQHGYRKVSYGFSRRTQRISVQQIYLTDLSERIQPTCKPGRFMTQEQIPGIIRPKILIRCSLI